jgi:hypothetical protein
LPSTTSATSWSGWATTRRRSPSRSGSSPRTAAQALRRPAGDGRARGEPDRRHPPGADRRRRRRRRAWPPGTTRSTISTTVRSTRSSS